MIGKRAFWHVLAFLVAAAPGLAQDWAEERVRYESEHPYANDESRLLFRIERPGAEALRLWFERFDLDQDRDWIDLRDGDGRRVQRLTGHRAGYWSETVPGDVVEVWLRSDSTNSDYGVLVTRVGVASGPVYDEVEVARIEARHEGRVVRPDDEVVLAPGEVALFEIVGFTRRGRPVEDFDFRPIFEASTGERLAAIELADPGTIRLEARRRGAEAVPVRIRDRHRPELAFGFDLSIRDALPGIESIAFYYRGSRLSSGNTLRIPPYGSIDLDVRVYGPGGERLDPALFEPRLESSGLVSLERRDADTIRLRAGGVSDRGVIVLSDARATSVRARLNVRIDRPIAAGPRIAGLQFLVPDGEGGWRPYRAGEPIELALRGRGVDRLPFAVRLLDSRGDVVRWEAAGVRVETNAQRWFGTIESKGGGEFEFLAGTLPSWDIAITAWAREDPSIRSTIRVQVIPPPTEREAPPPIAEAPPPVIVPGGPPPEHGHGGHDHGAPGHAHQPSGPPQTVQFGTPQKIPDWAKPENYFDFTFDNPGHVARTLQVHVTMNAPGGADLVRLEFNDGSQHVLATSAPVRAGQPLVIDVPPEVQDKPLQRVFLRMRGPKEAEVNCYVVGQTR